MDASLHQTLSLGAGEIGLSLDQEALERFTLYERELLLWNQRINLVSERSAREIVIRHFLDSLTAAPWIDSTAGISMDLGSGGGFPGIPLAIVMPQLSMTLVESSRKKSSFLLHIIRRLRLERVSVIRERVEALLGEKSCSGCFDTVLSRAAFKLPELIRMAAFFLKPGGQLIAMKGPEPLAEMAEAEAVLDGAAMTWEATREVLLPITKQSRKIISYRRVFR